MNQVNNSDSCVICQRIKYDSCFPVILRKALASKYSQSDNFFYQKDINDIMDERRSVVSIRYKDFNQLQEPSEYLRRFYEAKECKERMPAILEYYKYHINLARNFYSNAIGRRNERIRQIIYNKIKKELGLLDEANTNCKKEISGDCSAKMNYLLKDLKLESTQPDISRLTNSTVLKDLIKMIPEPKQKPMPLMPQKSKKPSLDLNKMVFLNGQQNNLVKTIQTQLKQQGSNLFKTPMTARPVKSNMHSRQNSGNLPNPLTQRTSPQHQRKVQNPLKSRQPSLITNSEVTKSSQATQKYKDALVELAKKMLNQKKACTTKKQEQNVDQLQMQQMKSASSNFFVKGTTGNAGSRKLYIEDLKNSMRCLRSRIQTPNRQCHSNFLSPNSQRKK